MWPTDPATPAGEAVRPTDKAPRCRAAEQRERRLRAGRGRAFRATDSRAREHDDGGQAAARAGRQGRRRRGAQENAEAVGPLQQDADASPEDEGREDVLVVQIGGQAESEQRITKSVRALLEAARRLRPLLF